MEQSDLRIGGVSVGAKVECAGQVGRRYAEPHVAYYRRSGAGPGNWRGTWTPAIGKGESWETSYFAWPLPRSPIKQSETHRGGDVPGSCGRFARAVGRKTLRIDGKTGNCRFSGGRRCTRFCQEHTGVRHSVSPEGVRVLADKIRGAMHAPPVFTTPASSLDQVLDAVNGLAEWAMMGVEPQPELSVDYEISFEGLTASTWEFMRVLGPFGEGNPEPVIVSRGLNAFNVRTVGGGGQHLRVDLESAGYSFPAIGFRLGGAPLGQRYRRRRLHADRKRLARPPYQGAQPARHPAIVPARSLIQKSDYRAAALRLRRCSRPRVGVAVGLSSPSGLTNLVLIIRNGTATRSTRMAMRCASWRPQNLTGSSRSH